MNADHTAPHFTVHKCVQGPSKGEFLSLLNTQDEALRGCGLARLPAQERKLGPESKSVESDQRDGAVTDGP